MTETDSKKIKDAEWYRQHTLTPVQRNKLIAEKLARANQYHNAFKERESRCNAR